MQIKVRAPSIRGEVILVSHAENATLWAVSIKGYNVRAFNAENPSVALQRGLEQIPFLEKVAQGVEAETLATASEAVPETGVGSNFGVIASPTVNNEPASNGNGGASGKSNRGRRKSGSEPAPTDDHTP